MKFHFTDKAITGMMVVVPEQERLFADDMRMFNAPENRSRKLAMVMGYRAHRVVEEGVCASDLAEYGFRTLFADGKLKPEEIDALVYVTISPDHFMPPTSCILHGKLGLRRDCFCLDVSQGCCGFVVGLLQAFQLLEQKGVKKVVVVNADVISRKVSPKDRNSYPLIGDAATIAIVENREGAGDVFADRLRRGEVERGALNGFDFARRNERVVGRQIAGAVERQDGVENRAGVRAAKIPERVVRKVDRGRLVGRRGIVDRERVVVLERVDDGDVEFARIALVAVRRRIFERQVRAVGDVEGDHCLFIALSLDFLCWRSVRREAFSC